MSGVWSGFTAEDIKKFSMQNSGDKGTHFNIIKIVTKNNITYTNNNKPNYYRFISGQIITFFISY